MNISAGELFDLISPVVLIVSALISIWVFTSARKRFPLWVALPCAVGTVFQPLIVLPIYLIVVLVRHSRPSLELRWRLLLPIVYAVVVLGYVAITFYRDRQSVDAHMARAMAARLVEDKEKMIQEYRKSLAIEDDAHVHKLLGAALADAGYFTEAISEYRLAETKGDPDDVLPFRIGLVLERIEQKGQARLEFERFLISRTCTRVDNRCEYARQRVESSY